MTHPGETEPGPPGGYRKLCPLCDWYLDVPAFSLERARVPRGANFTSINDLALAVARAEFDEVEAAIRDHLVSAHTAPVVLDS